MAPGRRRSTNLLGSLGDFVGREVALEALAAHEKQRARLVTILGPPGMGKTRLAKRYAELRGDPYLRAGGVWFCDLTEARSEGDLCAIVAGALGLQLRTSVDESSAWVANALAEAGPLLLILDNIEPIAQLAGRVLAHWCAVAPEAFLLVTSRERLAVAGETVLDLGPLTLPAVTAANSTASPNREELRASEALRLYEERSRAVGGWSDTQLADAATLVRALEGLPLAIELAAARSRLLGAGKILSQLALSSSSAGSSRHVTLRAAIDGSWATLSDGERSALAQCSIFAGDFGLEDVEAVVAVPGQNVAEILERLLDKSLVRRSHHDGAPRFSLYASIREYAAEHGAKNATELELLATRHRRHIIESTRSAAEGFARAGDAGSRTVLVRERENLLAVQRSLTRSAAKASLGAADAEDLARVTLHLQPVIAAQLSFEELIAMLGEAIAAATSTGDDGMRGRLLVARGSAYGVRGQSAPALTDLELASSIGRASADPVLEAEARVMASVRYRHQGRFDDARAAAEHALELLAGRDEPRIETAGRAVLGLLFCELDDVVASRRENLRARALALSVGDRWSEALALANLAQLDQAAGDHEKSAHGYEAALERFVEQGDRRYESRYLGYRAGLELERGDLIAARSLYATALEMLVGLRITHTEALFRGCAGALEARDGRASAAMTELARASSLLATVGAPAAEAAVELHYGQLDLLLASEAQARGDHERAEQLVQAARGRLRDARLVDSSEDVRFARRLLERALHEHQRRASSAPPAIERSVPGLLIGPRASWFRVGGETEPTVDLERRGALRLLLLALVERHAARTPEAEALSWEALLAAGWPGERVLAAAGSTRVRVAISTLRRLGLAGLLMTRSDGYLLDPRAIVATL